jgi:hypothetical protein
MAAFTWAGVIVGSRSRYKAATPEAKGVAILVPVRMLVAVELLYQALLIAVPGLLIQFKECELGLPQRWRSRNVCNVRKNVHTDTSIGVASTLIISSGRRYCNGNIDRCWRFRASVPRVITRRRHDDHAFCDGPIDCSIDRTAFRTTQ